MSTSAKESSSRSVLVIYYWKENNANMVILEVAEITKYKDFRLSNLSDEAWVLF